MVEKVVNRLIKVNYWNSERCFSKAKQNINIKISLEAKKSVLLCNIYHPIW